MDVRAGYLTGPSFGGKAAAIHSGALSFEDGVWMTARWARLLEDYFATEHRDIVTHSFIRTPQDQLARILAEMDQDGAWHDVTVDRDEGPRADTTVEALAALRPVFAKDGCVTAGNSSQLSDGAAALVLMSGRKARELGVRPLARYVANANVALDPLWLFEAPVPTIRQLLKKTDTQIGDWDAIELNEAFAAQMVADVKLLGLDPERVNVHGGAIALGHPPGCSGARLLTTLLYDLRRRGGGKGIGAACLGGGEAYAVAVETV
jgi:acetyl-CoA acetyltransferase family protein